VVLPLYAAWATVAALSSEKRRSQLLCAVAAGVAVAAHAATWNGWPLSHAIVTLGIGATLMASVIRAGWSQRTWRPWTDSEVIRIGCILVAYFVTAAVLVTASGSDVDFIEANGSLLGEVSGSSAAGIPAPFDAETTLWPEEFSTVSELLKLRDNNLTSFTTNIPLLFVAFLGAVVLALGRQSWTRQQWILFGAAAIVLGYASFNAPDGPRLAGVLVFAPAAAAVLAALTTGDRRRDDIERGALVLIVWLVAAYSFSARANRFVMFYAPPVGLAAGVVAGWLFDLITDRLGARLGRGAAVTVSSCAVAALLATPMYRGYVTARDFLPKVNDAWWDTFTAIRNQAPPEAIVNLWWHDGHWAKFISERGVIADGASLRTHINYWFRHALLEADERRAAGLLRMLDCGSDALPYPEGASGAYGKLRSEGLSILEARDLVDRLAGESRSGAEQLLSSRGLKPAAIAGILAATHCDPPPMYLVLGDDLATTAGWGNGLWDFRRAYIVRRARHLPRDEALRELTDTLGYTPSEARQLHRVADKLRTRDEVRNFIAPEIGFLTKTWIECSPDARGAFNVCPLARNVTGGAQVLEALEYSDAAPAGARLRIRKAGADGKPSYSYRTPGTVFVAYPHEFRRVPIVGATDPGIAVLIDLQGKRLLMAEAVLLGSTFTKLVFLDGRYLQHFEKISVRDSVMNDRVVSYRVRP
jgi:hypothetical protein